MMTLPGKLLRVTLIVAFVCGSGATLSRGQTATESSKAVDTQPLTQRYAAKLAALDPANPSAYLLLAEEVADAASSPGDQRLAIELFARAFEAARTKPGASEIAASACRGLADAAKTTKDRKWYEVLAALVDPAGAPPGWLRKPPPTSVDSTPYRIAQLLGLLRAGEGILARQHLEKPEMRQALVAMEPLLRRGGVAGGVPELDRLARIWPCRECSNRGAVRRSGTNPPEYKPCPQCLGKPGPRLSPEELTAQLRLESWLLQGLQRSWAAQLTSDDGAPLTDPDPAGLCARAGVDAARMFWRNGRFVRFADGTDELPASPAEKPEAKPTVAPPAPALSGS